MSGGESDAVRFGHDLQTRIAIAGIPGAGKTTLAYALGLQLELPVLSSGDVARAIDRAAIEAGDIADPVRFSDAWQQYITPYLAGGFVIDGMPRYAAQLELLPAGTRLLVLNCRKDIAVDRLRRRGREDDTEEIIGRRVAEQSRLLGLDDAAGWIWSTARWGSIVDTSTKSPEKIAADVVAYLSGAKRQAF